jgi:crossover junction endodeoxyribonuclease RuvC
MSEPHLLADPSYRYCRVAGVDLSLTSTGVCILQPDGVVKLITIPGRSIPRKETPTLRRRWERIHNTIDALADIVGSCDLIVIEASAYAAGGATTVDQHGMWWNTVDRLHLFLDNIVVVSPTTRGKWATGSGRADKAAVAAAMARRLPEVTFANSDEADAAALAYMGAQWLGWRPGTKVELATLKAITWPTGVTTP